MPENMSISVNGQSQVPPGFRFHPTEEELLNYYLKKKVSFEKIDLDVIRDVDLNKLEPWDIQERCKIGTTPQNDWYFFSHKDKKYPTGTRTNRATAVGFWKATGRDKVIYSVGGRIGMRKTLVFYKGRAPHGQKSDWIMHEYRLDDNISNASEQTMVSNIVINGEATQEEGWVICRIFKKKNHHKSFGSPLNTSPSYASTNAVKAMEMLNYSSKNDSSSLDQVLNTCKEESDHHQKIINNASATRVLNISGGLQYDRFLKLPSLESPRSDNGRNSYHPIVTNHNEGHTITSQVGFDSNEFEPNLVYTNGDLITNWAALDRLVASQLHVQSEALSRQIMVGCFSSEHNHPSNMAHNFGPSSHENNYQGDTDNILLSSNGTRPSSLLSSNNMKSYVNGHYHATIDDHGGNQDYHVNEIVNHLWNLSGSSQVPRVEL